MRVGGLDIDAVCALSVREAQEFLARLGPEADDGGAGARVVSELERRLRYLADVGLDYLTLGRRVLHPVRGRGAADRAGLRPRAPRWWGRCTSSTSRRSASIPATPTA